MAYDYDAQGNREENGYVPASNPVNAYPYAAQPDPALYQNSQAMQTGYSQTGGMQTGYMGASAGYSADPAWQGYSDPAGGNSGINDPMYSQGMQANPYAGASGAYAGYDGQGMPGYAPSPNAYAQSGSWNGYSQGYPAQMGTGTDAQQGYSLYNQQGQSFQPSREYSTIQRSYTAPQATLYTGPVEGLGNAAQGSAIPTPQRGMQEKMGKLKPWMKWAIPAAAVLLIAVIAFVVWPRDPGYTAEDVVRALYNRGIPIAQAYTYTVDTDSEHLLGTPGGYTSKAAWVDQTLENGNGILDNGGMVEVFASSADAERRYEELSTMKQAESGRVMQINRVVMRLSLRLSPSSLSMYQTAFKTMFNQR